MLATTLFGVLAYADAWHTAQLAQGVGHLRIAINLSALQFRDPLFVDTFRTLLAGNQVPASQIELELTESTLMHDLEESACRLTCSRQTAPSSRIFPRTTTTWRLPRRSSPWPGAST